MTIFGNYICDEDVWELLLDFVAGNVGSREALTEYAHSFTGDVPPQILALRDALDKPSGHREASVSRTRRSALVRFLCAVLSAGAGQIVFEKDLKCEKGTVFAKTAYKNTEVPYIVGLLLGMSPSTVEKLRPRNEPNAGRIKRAHGATELHRQYGPAEDEELSQRVSKYLATHPGQIVLPCDFARLMASPFLEFLTDPTFEIN
jgi:hypothetical protein